MKPLKAGAFECSSKPEARKRLIFAFCSRTVCLPRPGWMSSRSRPASSRPGIMRGGAVLPLTKRQREILDYLNDFIQQHGYAPSLEEIGRRFNLSSLATVHKHLTNLEEKGFIKRAWNRSRSVERSEEHTSELQSPCNTVC